MAKIILLIIAAVIAVLYQLESDSSYWTAHSTVRLDVFPDEVMRFIANVDQMEKVWCCNLSFYCRFNSSFYNYFLLLTDSRLLTYF